MPAHASPRHLDIGRTRRRRQDFESRSQRVHLGEERGVPVGQSRRHVSECVLLTKLCFKDGCFC